MWLHAFVTDFLTRARENNFDVPQKKFDAALERLRNLLANASDIGAGQGAPIAYAAYVLARNGREVMGDLRYLADAKLDAFESSARPRAACRRARFAWRSPARRGGFRKGGGAARARSAIRFIPAPIMARVCAMAPAFSRLPSRRTMPAAEIARASKIVEDARAKTALTSTQENAFMVLAAEALAGRSETIALSVDGAPKQGRLLSELARRRARLPKPSPSPIMDRGR